MNYELCEHGKRIGLDDCETCSVVGLKSQLRRMLEERNEARSKLQDGELIRAELLADNKALSSRLDEREKQLSAALAVGIDRGTDLAKERQKSFALSSRLDSIRAIVLPAAVSSNSRDHVSAICELYKLFGEVIETDQSGPCGAMFADDPHSYCRLENDHEGPHDMVSRERRVVEKHEHEYDQETLRCAKCGEHYLFDRQCPEKRSEKQGQWVVSVHCLKKAGHDGDHIFE